jgi:hypothetical protein
MARGDGAVMALLCRVLAAASIAQRKPEEGDSADVDEEKLHRCFEMLQAVCKTRSQKWCDNRAAL